MFTLYGLENAGANEQMLGRVEWASSVLQRMPTSVLQSVVREERPSATSEAAGNVSERKVMTIDIHPTDTFAMEGDGGLIQYRGSKTTGELTYRRLGQVGWNPTNGSPLVRAVTSELAHMVIAAAGHTITEAQPAPTPVPWPTHAVLDCTGALVAFGDAKTCNAYSNAEVSAVRPLAPAPLSPAMVTLLKALDDYFHQQPMLAATCINVSIRNLLAEGGAA
jgi:hypothetical protein